MSKRPPVAHPSLPGAMIVPLTKNNIALIDERDALAVGMHTWSTGWSGADPSRLYAVSKIRGRMVSLHRFVWNLRRPPTGDDIDHKSGDSLDCRLDNLRPATPSQNVANSRLSRRNKSGFKGVHRARSGNWVARLATKRLGTFATPELAHAAYMEAAIEKYGQFARAN